MCRVRRRLLSWVSVCRIWGLRIVRARASSRRITGFRGTFVGSGSISKMPRGVAVYVGGFDGGFLFFFDRDGAVEDAVSKSCSSLSETIDFPLISLLL